MRSKEGDEVAAASRLTRAAIREQDKGAFFYTRFFQERGIKEPWLMYWIHMAAEIIQYRRRRRAMTEEQRNATDTAIKEGSEELWERD